MIHKHKDTLAKGETMPYLDYIITHCSNGDGLVLYHKDRKEYETHLGNYGDGDCKENLNNCKKAALIFYMLKRPELYAHNFLNRILYNAKIMRQISTLITDLNKHDIPMPKEVSAGDFGIILFNGKPI